jgi:hypothetical protein
LGFTNTSNAKKAKRGKLYSAGGTKRKKVSIINKNRGSDWIERKVVEWNFMRSFHRQCAAEDWREILQTNSRLFLLVTDDGHPKVSDKELIEDLIH